MFLCLCQLCEDREIRESKGEWRKQSAAISDELDMPVPYHEWSSKHTLTGVPKNSREHNVIDCAHWAWRVAFKDGRAKMDHRGRPCWFADCSQSVEGKPWSARPGTQAMNSRWYSFQLDMVLTSKAMLFVVLRCNVIVVFVVLYVFSIIRSAM